MVGGRGRVLGGNRGRAANGAVRAKVLWKGFDGPLLALLEHLAVRVHLEAEGFRSQIAMLAIDQTNSLRPHFDGRAQLGDSGRETVYQRLSFCFGRVVVVIVLPVVSVSLVALVLVWTL